MATGRSPWFDNERDCEAWQHPKWLRDAQQQFRDVFSEFADEMEIDLEMTAAEIAYRQKEAANIHWHWRCLRELGFFTVAE